MKKIRANVSVVVKGLEGRLLKEVDGWLYEIWPAYVFLHETVGKNKPKWACSEFYTGYLLSKADDMQAALDQVAARLADRGPERFFKAQTDCLNKEGYANERLPE